MDFMLIGIGIAIIIIALVLFYFLHGVFKIVAGVLSLVVLVGVIIGGIVVVDAYKFQKGAQEESMLYVLMDGDEVVTGMVMQPGEDSPQLITDEEQELLKSKEYDELLQDYYKLWLFTPKVIDDMDEDEFELSGQTIQKSQLKAALLSDSPETLFDIPEGQELSQTTQELKLMVFGGVIVQSVMQDPMFLFSEYKKGHVQVEAETPLFKFMKIIPTSFIRSMLHKSMSMVSNKVS